MKRVEMMLSGDSEILKRIRDTDPDKNGILSLGGGQAGIIGAAEFKALFEAGIVPDMVKNVMGVSSGAGNAWYTYAGNPDRAISMYRDDNVEGRLFRARLIFPPLGMAYEVLEQASRNKEPADLARITALGVNFRVAVTSTRDWQAKFIKIDEVEDPVTLLMGAMYHPIMGNKYEYVTNGEVYIDAIYSDGVPLEYMINQMGVENLLVLDARPLKGLKVRSLIVSLCKLFQPGLGGDFYRAFSSFYDKYNAMVPYLQGKLSLEEINLATIHPRFRSVDRFERNRTKLIKAAQEAYQGTKQLIENYS